MNSISLFEQAGINVPSNLQNSRVSEVFENTGLNWNVVQKPIYYKEDWDDNNFKKFNNQIANFRSDTHQFLGIVHPKEYKVVQNIEAFNFIDELQDFTFEKVGTFNGGKKVYIVGKTNDKIYIDGSTDPIDMYLTFLHGHDGKSSIKFLLSPIRMFCTNQMNLIMKSSSFNYSIRHTGNVEFKLAQVHQAINESHLYVNELQSTIQNMLITKATKSIEQVTNILFPFNDEDTVLIETRKQEARETIRTIYNNKDDIQNYKGSVFGIVSAISDYISHLQPKRMTSSAIDNQFIKNLEGNSLIEQTRLLLAA